MPKIAFIGAGSVEFTRNVVTDLCSFEELHGNLELSLHDINAERLGYADALARRINAQSGAGATITSSVDRLTAVEGANYVVNEIKVGGF
jgi:alpha-galactosidase